jgi:membrane protein YqaA with SNARE-associated domain
MSPAGARCIFLCGKTAACAPALLQLLASELEMRWLAAFAIDRGLLQRLGGVGLVVLGLADNSLVPLPGSVDALTIVLAASRKEWWWYYALMAAVGSVLGGYLTYRLGSKGGKEALEKNLSKDKAAKAYRAFERWGFGSVFVPALLPPPVPIVPFLLTAGALQYSTRKFLAALAAGRALRYTLLAWLGSVYGAHIFRFFGRYYKPVLIVLVALAVIGGMVAVALLMRRRKVKRETRQAKAA